MRRRAPEFDETAIGRAVIGIVGVSVVAVVYHLLMFLVGR